MYIQHELKRILQCTQKRFDTNIIPLYNIYSVKDDIKDLAFDNIFNKSLDTKGMLNPILVCKQSDYVETFKSFERRHVPDVVSETYRCMIGNNRYDYAKRNGYTYIECIVVTSLEELKTLHRNNFIEPRKM